jgi:hypothetical protein
MRQKVERSQKNQNSEVVVSKKYPRIRTVPGISINDSLKLYNNLLKNAIYFFCDANDLQALKEDSIPLKTSTDKMKPHGQNTK